MENKLLIQKGVYDQYAFFQTFTKKPHQNIKIKFLSMCINCREKSFFPLKQMHRTLPVSGDATFMPRLRKEQH